MIEAETTEFVSLSIPRQFGNYTVQKILGQGSTCVVVEAMDRLSGKDYAVKVMSYSDLKSRNLLLKVERELGILRRISHEHVLRFHEFRREGDLMFIVTENCVGGDLLSWIVDGRVKEKRTMKRLFYEIALGVQYLHSQGIAHNDIKPENVVIDGSGRAKLGDFGYAKTETFAGDDEKSGTLMYAAPELFGTGWYHTQRADIWSLGIVLYTLATGTFPFDVSDEQRVVRQICQGRLKYQRCLDREVELLVRRMTKTNANKRPTIESVLEDGFFDDVRLVGSMKPAVSEPASALCVSAAEAEMESALW
jgi:MAP/microtubule affinity-regulating kinase